MRIGLRIGFSVFILLSIVLGSIAAQEPIKVPHQEPIQEAYAKSKDEWKQQAIAFMAGIHPRLGRQSTVNQLSEYVARDIVKLAKPKEEYGFIKNYTDKQITFLFLDDRQKPSVMLGKLMTLIKGKMLSAHYEIRFLDHDQKSTDQMWSYICEFTRGLEPAYFDVYVQFQNDAFLRGSKKVPFYHQMNMKVYEDGKAIKLEITAPNHEPVSMVFDQRRRFL